jgi:septum formation protein
MAAGSLTQARCFPMQSSPALPLLQLASASPRRRELLLQLQLAHVLLSQNLDESRLPDEAPLAYVQRLARDKAAAARHDPAWQEHLPVLAADTTVVCEGRVLGKPASQEEALDMLGLLSGRAHQVHTAVAVLQGDRLRETLSSSTVYFRHISDEERLAYWQTGEPRDKAGAYAVQGLGAMFIQRIEGSYSGIMGLPLHETVEVLREFGITPMAVLANQRKESST